MSDKLKICLHDELIKLLYTVGVESTVLQIYLYARGNREKPK
jgi:hypothetical protein